MLATVYQCYDSGERGAFRRSAYVLYRGIVMIVSLMISK